jgi:hypothetical protein
MFEKITSEFQEIADDLRRDLDGNVSANGGRLDRIPLDSTITDADKKDYWDPKFSKYSARFGKVKTIDSCHVGNGMNSNKNIFDKSDEDKEETWGNFNCGALTDSGKIDLMVDAKKYRGTWHVLDLKIQE